MKFQSFLSFNEPEVLDTTELDIVFIDQQPAMEFNRNEFGWPRNDISAFELAGSDAEASAILARFQELPQTDVYKDMTDEQKFQCVCPRRATSDPVLFSKFQEQLASVQYDILKDKANETKDKKDNSGDSTIYFENSESKTE